MQVLSSLGILRSDPLSEWAKAALWLLENMYELFPRRVTMSILKVHAREIFDSRGNPTVEVDLYTSKGMCHICFCSSFCHTPTSKTYDDRALDMKKSIIKKAFLVCMCKQAVVPSPE